MGEAPQSSGAAGLPEAGAFADERRERFFSELEQARPDGPDNFVLVSDVSSTNALARQIARATLEESAALESCLLVAYRQSAGRGRLGRSWESPPGAGVYATWLLPIADRTLLERLPLIVAVGLARALDRYLPAPGCRLKWPNDLMFGDGKLGGILIETVRVDNEPRAAVIGFGINYGSPEEEWPPGAVSLLEAVPAGGPAPTLAELLWELVDGLVGELERSPDAATAVDEYARRSLHREGDPIRHRQGHEVVEGVFRGFSGRGFLRLEVEGEIVELSAGEVA